VAPERDAARSGEDEARRLDRELIELLNELRVALPGVQVLFGFLLVVPFSVGWRTADGFQRNVYFFTMLCTAVASVLLIAPSSYHRIVFRHREKPRMIQEFNRLVIAGLAFLAAALIGTVLLISDYLFGGLRAGIATAVVGAALLSCWYALPLRRRADEESW